MFLLPFPPARSFDPGSVLPDAGGTRGPAHVAAPQAAALQRRRAQSVAGGDSFDSQHLPTVKFDSSVSLFMTVWRFLHFVFLSTMFVQKQYSLAVFLKLLINVLRQHCSSYYESKWKKKK